MKQLYIVGQLHHFSPIRITLNDLESPFHLQMRIVDGTLDVPLRRVLDSTIA